MNQENGRPPRRPQAFAFEPEEQRRGKAKARQPEAFEANIVVTRDEDDPFIGSEGVDLDAVAAPRRRGFPWFALFASAFGLLLSASLGLWVDGLIRSLYARADWLGYTAIAATVAAVVAILVMVGRELIGLRRLASVQALKRQAEIAALDRKPAHARAVVARLVTLMAANPETAHGRARLAATRGDIIDSEGILRLAELELLDPVDRRARQLVLAASKRVSVVTAVSPRALVDLGYVLFEAAKLIRAIAETYGTHPGKIGMVRLFRDVIAHLAVTGSIAVGDGIIQQLLGH